MGPSTDPCGTPHTTEWKAQVTLVMVYRLEIGTTPARIHHLQPSIAGSGS